MEIEVLAIELEQEPIELCKLLKIANLVSGGGEAKMVISEGYVHLNGEIEYQKRKKIFFEDIVQFNGEAIMAIKADSAAIDDTFTSSIDYDDTEDAIADNSLLQAPDQEQPVVAAPTTNTSKAQSRLKNSSKTKKAKKNNLGKAKKKPNESNPRTGRKSISF